MKLDISVIVLTLNEQIHIERCIKNALLVAKDVFVVDCFSKDNTVEICERLGAKVYQNQWPGSQAVQLNWALQNIPIKTKWLLRLDADEYLTPELIAEIKIKLNALPADVTGIVIPLRRIFLGREMKNGVGRVMLMRFFQPSMATCEQRLMDEHMQLLEGRSVEFEHAFFDHNLNNLAWWTEKHNGYALREALDMLDIELGLLGHSQGDAGKVLGEQAGAKRLTKYRYVKLPLFWRSALYFFVRYVLKGGFLDGKEGFLWHFLQGWWYRTLVDAKIFEIKQACGSDVDGIKAYLLEKYQIDCNRENPFSRK